MKKIIFTLEHGAPFCYIKPKGDTKKNSITSDIIISYGFDGLAYQILGSNVYKNCWIESIETDYFTNDGRLYSAVVSYREVDEATDNEKVIENNNYHLVLEFGTR